MSGYSLYKSLTTAEERKKLTRESAIKARELRAQRAKQKEAEAAYKAYADQIAEWDRVENLGKGIDEKTLNDELDRLTKEADAKGYIWDPAQKRLSSIIGLSASDDYKDLEKQLIDVNNALDVKKRQKLYGITDDYARVNNSNEDIKSLLGADDDTMKYYNRWLIHNGATSNEEVENSIKQYKEAKAAERTIETGRDYPVSSLFLSAGLNLGGVIDTPKQFITGEKNPYTEIAAQLRQGATADRNGVDTFLYNVVASGLESAVAAFIPGGAVILGMSAASQTFNDIIDRGGTHDQAFIGGLAAGAFEGFFEHFSIERLKSMKLDEITASFKAFAKNMGKQAATNAQEEAATEVANILFDSLTMGDISNAALMIEQYVAQGMSESEAKRKVAGEFTSQILESAASGAVMGLGFGLGGAGVGAVSRSNEARGTVKDQRKLDDLIEAGEAVFTGAEYGRERELLDKIKANKASTNMAQRNRVGKLDRSIDKYTMEKVAPNAPSLEEVKRAMSEEALDNVSQTLKSAREAASEVMIGKDVTYNSMPSIVEFDGDGGIVVQGKDGTKKALSDMSFEDDEIYEAYVLATTTGSVENANRFLEQYRLNSNSSTADVESLWTAYMGGLSYGQTMTSETALEEAVKRFASDTMPDTVIKSAFLSGRSLRESADNKYITLQKNYDKAWKEAGGKESVANFDDSAIRGMKLDSTQQEFRSFLRTFSRAMGTNIEIFASEKGNRHENGSYNRDTNTVRIDINAGISNKSNYNALASCLVNTLSHESVHNMRVTAKEEYSALRDFVLSVLQSAEDYDLEAAVQAEYEKAKANGRKNFTREDAIEEIVARACEDRLGSSEKLRDFMIEFYNKDKKAANSFVRAVREFLTRLKAFFENIAKQKSSSEEAQLIASQGKEIISELQKRFDDALMSMREGNIARNAVEAVNVSIDTATESASPIMLSEATWRESEYVTKEEEAAEALAKALDVSKADALKYIKNVNSIAKMIANDRARLDYVASSFGSAFVSNVEYGGSFDFTTLCKKRRVFTGTFQEIQKRLGEVALTPDQILEIRNLLIKAHLEAPCGLCYVEGSRANMGKFAKEFIRLYKRDNPNAWAPKMVDVNTPDGVEQMRINHPEAYEQYEYFWNHYGKLKDSDPALFASQQKPKLYEARKAYANEILDRFTTDTGVDKKNRNGGIRMQSFSDFEIIHAIDTMQIIMDMSRVGLAGQAYTKVPEFAKAFGDTGLKINLSLIAKGVDENGRIIFDDREGMPHETAFDIRKKHSKNVGTILVIFNDKQLYAAMADDRIDFIIPFHRSQWKKGQYSAMGLPEGTKDYTYMQNEKLIKPTYHEYHGRMVKDKASNYMPNEYWKFYKSGKENAEEYLKMCAENNKRPKFYKLLDYDGKGTYSLKADGSTDGYWKLLIDFKMYDNDGNGSPQMPVRPDFSMGEIRKMLKEYEGGHASYPIAHNVVDEFVEKYDSKRTTESWDSDKYGNTMFMDREKDQTDTSKRYSLKGVVVPTREQLENKPPMALVDLNKPKTHGSFAERRKQILASVDDIIAQPYLNEDTKTFIFLTKKSYTHMFSNQGEVQLTAAENIPEFIKNAVLTHVEDTSHGNSYANKIYTFFAAAKYGETVLPVKLKVKEYKFVGQELPKNISEYFNNAPQDYASSYDTVILEVEAIEKSPTGSVKDMNLEDSFLNPIELSEISIPELLALVKGESKKYIPDYKETTDLYQERTETPEPSEVLRELFETNAAFAGYKSYTASLKKYQELMQRVDGYEKQIADIDDNITRLRSERRQSGKGTRIGDLSDKRIAIEKKIEQAKNKMFAMEAKELNSVVRAETKRLVQDERTKARLMYNEKSKERRDNASKQHYIESIGKRVKAMQEKLVKNSADHHIPDALKAPIAELLTALDFSSKRSLQGGAPTKKEADLKAAVDRITKLTSGINPEDIPPLDLPPRFKDQWDEVVRVVDAYTWGRGKLYPDKMILQEMDVASLRSLNRALMDIQHAVSVANETIAAANMAPINVLANDLYSYLKNDVKEAKVEGKGVWQAGKNFITWENTLPVYAFDRLGEVGQKLFATFQDGFDKLVTEVNQIIETTEKTYTQKEVQSWRKQVYDFKFDTINGESRTLYLTTPQIMSLYCLSKREQAKKHFAGGGIVAEDIRISVKEKYKNSAEGVRLTEQALERIIGKLTDRQKKVADELQTFMTDVCAEWGNEVAYKRWGIRPLTEENYFPIDTKSSTRDKESTSPQRNTQLYALLNMSFTKQINENANNQIIISDIFDVFADHSSSMARYHTLALPVLDFMKVYNYREKQYSNTSSTDKSFEEKNPRDALKDAFGTAGVKYIEDFLATINGANWTRDKDQLSKSFSKVVKTAMVGFNIRTVVQQPTSIVRALMYLDATDIVVSLNPMGVKKAKDLALKYCPMARWKSMGYFDIGTGRGMVNMIAKTPNWRDSAIEKSLYLAEKADEVTWAYLWKATEHWVSRHTKFTKGTDAYYNACGEKLREVIYRTQVVDSPLTKSQYMSSDSETKKMISMFASESTVTYNMIQAEVYALAKETKMHNRKKHALRIVKFTGIFAAQALFLAAVQSIPDAIRDDDDDEELGEKYINAYFENLLSELNPFNKLPIMRDIVSTLEGFTVERTDAIIWNKASKAIKAIIKAIGGKGNISAYETIYAVLVAASSATGIGVSNAIRDVVALWNTLMEEIDPSLKIE